jgi:DNA glycosylase AlkZ-like
VTTLGPGALNRALLERQLLLQRAPRGVEDALEHLVGLQAQAPLAPYVALWSRLRGFDPADLSAALEQRRAVRTTLMRVTIHLVTARDALALRPLVQPVAEQVFRTSQFHRDVAGVDLDEVLRRACALVEERPRTRVELGAALGEHFTDGDPASLAYAFTFLSPLVHVPPRGVWGTTGPVALTTVQSWLGGDLTVAADPDTAVLRYLAAFGPATVADVAKWSRVTGLRAVVERLRPRLRTFCDATGRELFDVPGAPLPDPDTLAPPRFLPEFDNVLVAHANRARIIEEKYNAGVIASLGRPTVLVGGFVRGYWKVVREDGAATLLVEPFEALSKRNAAAVRAEGRRLLAFAAPDADTREVRVPAAGQA